MMGMNQREKASHDSDVMGLSEVAQQWSSEEEDGEVEEDGACEEDLECNQVEEEENFVQGQSKTLKCHSPVKIKTEDNTDSGAWLLLS